MNAEFHTRSKWMTAFILILLWTLPACLPPWDAPTAAPTFFRPPSGSASPTTPLPGPSAVAPTPTIPPPTPGPTPACANGLAWLADLTFEDDTVVLPGQFIDKQWLVQNSGACDWDARYRLRWVGGETLGAPTEVALYPARAGARVTLRIIFTAPAEAGSYQSAWQAVSPDGTLFGDSVYLLIIVGP